MKIDRINPAGISGIYKNNQNKSNSVKNKNIKKDGLILTKSGQIFNEALKAVKDMDVVNEAKISKIAGQIKANSYKVSNDELAEKIIKGAFFDKTV